MEALRSLGVAALRALADELRARGKGLALATVRGRVPPETAEAVHAELVGWMEKGWTGAQLAVLLLEMAAGKERERAVAERYQLVLSPPELDRVDARDTAAVIQELFRAARHRLLIATFVLDKPEACKAIFGELARRMDDEASLDVELIVNIARGWTAQGLDTSPAEDHLRRYVKAFREELWPGKRLPKVYYDPRALDTNPQVRASMHAKLVVADGERVFITSANFTEAAHVRNIEAGIVARDPALGRRLERQFRRLRERLELRSLLPG